jgi:hypothetical protein
VEEKENDALPSALNKDSSVHNTLDSNDLLNVLMLCEHTLTSSQSKEQPEEATRQSEIAKTLP